MLAAGQIDGGTVAVDLGGFNLTDSCARLSQPGDLCSSSRQNALERNCSGAGTAFRRCRTQRAVRVLSKSKRISLGAAAVEIGEMLATSFLGGRLELVSAERKDDAELLGPLKHPFQVGVPHLDRSP